MVLAGLDFGLSKVGIAIADGPLAEPYMILRYKDIKILEKEIKRICEKEKVEKIIIGVSEEEMAKKTREFIEELKREFNIPVEGFDETLSTYDAQKLSMESGMRRSKRKEMEDAIAAAVMLQSYLDNR